ncbi:polyadenylate-binding protein [Nematocida homosporus]|uniref:polyadenylate-binding protein n=1 Tax=Nematocida homosporus TaxID=1912981 RepID=UPI002220F723|nr:polyadenylate-binding protein [Nematocida homosporus]KAI5184529.1 polyadenylate-binding protein [Nematocida homosporus]
MHTEETKEKRDTPIGANNSIYVGDLPNNITESDLFQLFSSVGQIFTINIPRKESTKARVYAYVTFFDSSSVSQAIENFNFYSVHGCQIRVMPLNKEIVVGNRDANVVVKNLPTTTDNQSLYDTFSRFGKISSCKVQQNAAGECTGAGFIQFQDPKVAAIAIEMINKLSIGDKRLVAVKCIPSDQRRSKKEEINKVFTNVYVKGFPKEVEESDLRQVLEQYGELTSFLAPRTESGEMRGFVFANYAEHSSAVAAIAGLHGQNYPGTDNVLYIQRAKPKNEREEELAEKYAGLMESAVNRNVYVTNLSPEVTDESLLAHLAVYGPIVSHKLGRDEKNARAYAYVCFESKEAAAAAVKGANGTELGGRVLDVTFFKSKRTREMEKTMAAYSAYSNGYVHKGKRKSESTTGYELYTLILSLAPSYTEKIAQAGFSSDEEFAKKITGMILELGPEEVKRASVLGNVLSHYVEESLEEIIMHRRQETLE